MKFLNFKKTLIIVSVIIIGAIASISLYFTVFIYKVNDSYNKMYHVKNEVGLRKFPYPFKAALAIANDIDGTNTANDFLRIQEFFNTKNISNMGEGVGLEIGNSFFMFDQKDNFSYFSTKEEDKKIIGRFVEAGYLDSLHSWGEGYKDRNDAQFALDELKKNQYRIFVWINHSKAESNYGRWWSTNLGDNRDSKYYHADLTIPYGIKFVWLGQTTNVIGQVAPITFDNFFESYDPKYPFKTSINILKSVGKMILSIFGIWQDRYSLHETNDLVRDVTLDDGQKVYEFIRYDIHPDGIGFGTIGKEIAYNLSEKVFNHLKQVHGYGILYTHFGKNKDCPKGICEETRSSLRNLEKEYRIGEIYVTTTSKLLNYYIVFKNLKFTYKMNVDELYIEIHSIEDPVFGTYVPTLHELQGITFYVPFGKKVKIILSGEEIKNIIKNQADENNRESVTIPFKYNKYPDIKYINRLKQ